MLPTPSTSHVSFDTIYEPSEDSYLFLDTLSSPSESSWLSIRFDSSPPPLVVELGTGSGVVLAFAAANSHEIFGRRDILALGTDVNRNANIATQKTVLEAIRERQDRVPEEETDTGSCANTPIPGRTTFLSSLTADLASCLRPNTIDCLLFNPPYVPTEELPDLPPSSEDQTGSAESKPLSKFDSDSYFLSLTYAGGKDGMQITYRLLNQIPALLHPVRGVAYVLLCRQNRPLELMEYVRAWEGGWRVEVVGDSGGKAGWEKLVIVKIWRDGVVE